MTTTEQISEATIRRDKAASALSRAFDALCEAQNIITDVEANGLRSKVRSLQPTGLFE
jgi:hypothetical protein